MAPHVVVYNRRESGLRSPTHAAVRINSQAVRPEDRAGVAVRLGLRRRTRPRGGPPRPSKGFKDQAGGIRERIAST
jgi:hypothetical protein